MTGGWFVFGVVACIVICCGFVLALALMRAAWAQREKESLTSTDLRALEESALLLVEQITTESDRGISELDSKCLELRKLMREADEKIDSLRYLTALSVEHSSTQCVVQSVSDDTDQIVDKTRILELASGGMSSAEIARVMGIDCAEVNLILNLGKIRL